MAFLHVTGPHGTRIVVNARPGALAAIENNQTAYTFDDAGRLIGAFVDGFTYRRSLANDVLRKIYLRVPIMPPDQYLALALQATEGCSFNACTFCGFYRDRRFHVKTAVEFSRHVAAVKDFLGRGLSLRRSIFLGDANALMMPPSSLAHVFDLLNCEFAILPGGLGDEGSAAWLKAHPGGMTGVYSFIDAFTTRRKTTDDFAQRNAPVVSYYDVREFIY